MRFTVQTSFVCASFTLLLGLSGCGHKSSGTPAAPGAEPTPTVAPPAAPTPAPVQLTDNVAQPLLVKYCGTCHDGKGTDDTPTAFALNSAASAKAAPIAMVLTEMTGANPDMPPTDEAAAQPTAAERQQLVTWFQQQTK